MREDFVSSDHADTPFIDAFASDGVYFEDMFSTTTTTTPCVASFMTGCYSEKNGVNTHSYCELTEGLDTLAEVFRRNGYSTYAMPTGPLVEETQLDRGFDEYWYRDRNQHLYGEWGDTARNRIQELEEPFFLYLHLWELHWPIEVPRAFDSPEYGRYPYARALSALDRELESFIGALPDDTTVFLHGDHGESISGRGIPWAGPRYLYRKLIREKITYPTKRNTRPIARKINRLVHALARPDLKDHYLETGHGNNIFDFTTNVPFVVNAPGRPPARVTAQVRQIDVYPTVLDALGLESRSDTPIDGETLLPPEEVEDRDAYLRACGGNRIQEIVGRGSSWMRGMRANGYKLIEYPALDWPPELYDLESDPVELKPIDDPDVLVDLRNRLPDEELMDVEKADIDELLRDLGYL